MKTKKGEVIFCVGLLTVLINAVSSELLVSTFALRFFPDYRNIVDDGDLGKFLVTTRINHDYPFNINYNVDNSYGDEIHRIRFQTSSAAGEYPWLLSELWGGIPGIQVHPPEEQQTVQQYTFDGIEIDLEPISGTPHSLMRFHLRYYDENLQKFVIVKMMMIEKPTTQEGLRTADDYDVYDCENFKSFEELMSRMTSRQIPVNMSDDFPWIQDVLDRAKLMARSRTGPYPNIDWYYAGPIMVNRDIITSILRLHSRWERHIQN